MEQRAVVRPDRPSVRGSTLLLETEPELGAFLGALERAEARALAVPVKQLAPGRVDIGNVLEDERAFGAMVVDGMLMQRQKVVGHETLRLLGPGDLVAVTSGLGSSLSTSEVLDSVGQTTVAILGQEFLAAVRRWPGLVAGLHVRLGAQANRMATHLAICQLSRVSDRLLAMLWLLAESWGRVTKAGVMVPIAITHETLGALVGARRPTVTLALGELVERGAIVRRGRGWLLLEQVDDLPRSADPIDVPKLLDVDVRRGPWAESTPGISTAPIGEELLANAERLRRELGMVREQLQGRFAEVRATRDQVRRRRERFAQSAVSRRSAPSS